MRAHSTGGTGSTTPTVSGLALARSPWTRDQREQLAADILDGKVRPVELCETQVSRLCRADVIRVRRLRRNGHGRNGNGKRHNGETLAEHIVRSTAAEWQKAAEIVGLDVVWDTMISPALVSERTTTAK